MAEEAKNDYRDNIDDVTVLRMGEILIAQEDIIQQTATGEKELIKAGSKGVIGVDKLLHHYNGRISRFGDDVEIKGYCGSGIAQYLYDYLSNKLPLDEMLETYEITPENFIAEILDEMLETYEITPENFIAEITFLLDEIGISD